MSFNSYLIQKFVDHTSQTVYTFCTFLFRHSSFVFTFRGLAFCSICVLSYSNIGWSEVSSSRITNSLALTRFIWFSSSFKWRINFCTSNFFLGMDGILNIHSHKRSRKWTDIRLLSERINVPTCCWRVEVSNSWSSDGGCWFTRWSVVVMRCCCALFQFRQQWLEWIFFVCSN
jgi:hypothetical protein